MNQSMILTTDAKLRTIILDVFHADKRLSSANVRVGVLNSIVHLAGSVRSTKERSVTEELAKNVPGVLGVVNRIDSPDSPSPARTVNIKLKKKDQSDQ